MAVCGPPGNALSPRIRARTVRIRVVVDVHRRTGRVGAVTSAQPSGSSWRPSRVAARLYCSNKSYHPAITAPITPARDEYILACAPSLPSLSRSLALPRASLVAFVAAVSATAFARCVLSAPSSSPSRSRPYLFYYLLSSFSCRCDQRDLFSFHLLSASATSSQRSRDTRPDLFSRSLR